MPGRVTRPDTVNERALNDAILLGVLAERFKVREARRILRLIRDEVAPDLVQRLAGRLENIRTRGFDTGPRTTARLRYLFRDVENLFDELARRIKIESRSRLVDYADANAARIVRDLRRDVVGAATIRAPTLSAIRSAVESRPFEGFTVADRVDARARGFQREVERQVRVGLAQGDTSTKIVQRVRAIFPAQARRTALTARASVAHAQNQSRQVFYERNADLVKGVLWVATLDTATCPRCALLDGQVFPLDSGPRPPLHEGPCRCSTAPVLEARRSAGGTRASIDGQVPDAITFRDWIEMQTAERQDEVFGPGRAALFRAGRIGVEDMVDGAGNELSLARIREMLAAR